MNFYDYLFEKCYSLIKSWDKNDIYAISFLVLTNESNEYKGIRNFMEFSVGYNTESFCDNATKYSEDRWNYACWEQNNIPIIDCDEAIEGAEHLLRWFEDMNIKNVGEENDIDAYDEEMNYIGKGPIGYYELLCLVSKIARNIQETGLLKTKWGNIPIIVHDYEYAWYVVEATQNANPNGEAVDFLTALKNDFED